MVAGERKILSNEIYHHPSIKRPFFDLDRYEQLARGQTIFMGAYVFRNLRRRSIELDELAEALFHLLNIRQDSGNPALSYLINDIVYRSMYIVSDVKGKYLSARFWSEEACRLYSHKSQRGRWPSDLVHEHIVPRSHLAQCVTRLVDPTPQKILGILLYSENCILTKAEDNRLNRLFRIDMPPGWEIGHNFFARYDQLSPPIKLCQEEGCTTGHIRLCEAIQQLKKSGLTGFAVGSSSLP